MEEADYRRNIIKKLSVLSITLSPGCLENNAQQNEQNGTSTSENSNQSTDRKASSIQSDTSVESLDQTTKTATATDLPTYRITIDLFPRSESSINVDEIDPIQFDELPNDEQDILQSALGSGEYSIEYERGNREGAVPGALTDLIERILGQKENQEARSVFLIYEDQHYCIDLVDADQRYYSC